MGFIIYSLYFKIDRLNLNPCYRLQRFRINMRFIYFRHIRTVMQCRVVCKCKPQYTYIVFSKELRKIIAWCISTQNPLPFHWDWNKYSILYQRSYTYTLNFIWNIYRRFILIQNYKNHPFCYLQLSVQRCCKIYILI